MLTKPQIYRELNSAKMYFGPNLEILTSTSIGRQAQNGRDLDFWVQFDLAGQG